MAGTRIVEVGTASAVVEDARPDPDDRPSPLAVVRSCAAEAFAFWVLLRDVYRSDRGVRCCVWIILSASVAVAALSLLLFALLHAVFDLPALSRLVDVRKEGSLPEIFGHGLVFLTGALIVAASVHWRSRALIALAALHVFVWIDDSMQYHERFGGYLAEVLELGAIWGLRAKDTGELLAWGIAGLALLPVLLWATFRMSGRDVGILASFAPGFALLALFGIVGDMAHIRLSGPASIAVGFGEDVGEMLGLALNAAVAVVVLALARRASATDHP